MKKKDTHTPYFDSLERKITPNPVRVEPLIWFREVRLVEELSKEGVEHRRIVLHRGLNILWAEPENPDTEQGLYRDGLAGHASGKTLFCRLLRHILGESPFGTQAQRNGIASNFLSLWVIASVRVNQESWVVGRPLAASGTEFAIRAETIDEVLAGEPPTGGFKEFSTAVKTSAGTVADNLHPGEGWRHLLPWLTRDQEARFASLAGWREAASEGDNPQTKVSERHILMRAVLDLLDLREPALRAAIEADQAKLEAGLSTTTRLQTEVKSQADLAETRARDLVGDSAPGNVDALEQRVSSMIDVLREGLAQFERQPESPALGAARAKYEEARDRVTESEREVENLGTRIGDKTTQQKNDLAIVRNFRTGNVEDPIREAKGWCPKTIQFAREHHCIEKEKVSEESATNIADLETKALRLADEITVLNTKQAELKRQIPSFRHAQDQAKKALDEATRIANREVSALATRVEKANGVASLFQQAAKTQKALDAHIEAMTKLAEEIEQKKKEAAALRSDMAEKLRGFANNFADIVRAVMGASVEANVGIDANGITPHVTRKGELSGAALDTIKTLAFDLAAVVASIEGRGSHPRFLIHDGPREGDMARIIYERFFLYAAELEKVFPTPDEASFQYIITTTTHPPTKMREGSRWLLDPVLDSRDKDKRLFKEDF
ncbi:MAG: hypothetical protein WC076_06545 [Terrimicrobiaceae bacterium]|nr:hypothetical protein [Terrimicrobiaceae bacterium]